MHRKSFHEATLEHSNFTVRDPKTLVVWMHEVFDGKHTGKAGSSLAKSGEERKRLLAIIETHSPQS